SIDSIDEFKNILQTAHDDPALLKIYADLLVQKKMYDDAANIYREAAERFVDSGMMLPAIFCKVQEWSNIRSSDRECRSIYSGLRDIESDEIAVYDFFARMTYSELFAVIGELEPAHVQAGGVVKKPEDPENDIYFIVSGVLSETTYQPSEEEGEFKKVTENLTENHFLCDLYPFEEERSSSSVVDAITDVEALKISKSDLGRVCRKYPNIEFLTMELCDSRSESGGRKSFQQIRTSTRYQLQTKVTLKIFPDEEGTSALVLNGFTEDISLGGSCIRLGEKYWTGSLTEMVGKDVKILISVPKVSAGIDALGTIAWKREMSYEGRKTVLIGVRFKEMTKDNFEFLKKHSYVGDGEQDMIFSLWESYVKS
ncbi:MAG: PilZ domain-containing protein, partial [Deltaproteobacteria bacterium]|nr:PilZ domain-containing protein [Deltaproteobacteria bacterium]